MNILSLSTCKLDPVLGSGKTRLRWSEGLRRLGHSVDIFEPQDYEVWTCMKRALRFRQAWGAWKFVKDKLKSRQYDLVEFFGGEFGLATWELSQWDRRPFIVAHTDGLELLAAERTRSYDPPLTAIGHLKSAFASLTHEPLSRAAFVYADAFVTGCQLDLDYVLKHNLFSPQFAAVVEPGLDSEYLSRPFTSQKAECVAYVGTWIARKGVTILTKVIEEVLTRKPEVSFDIYGTGAQAGEILSYFSPVFRSRITVHPRLSNTEIAIGLSQAKVFFFPSQYEGFGMALAEAMACSCAPVTTRTGFGGDLRDGEEAILCDYTDVLRMTEAVVALLENEKLRIKISEAAWKRVQKLSWDDNIQELESIYSNWVSCHN